MGHMACWPIFATYQRTRHTVRVEPKTHLVYCPLETIDGRPLLPIMEPVMAAKWCGLFSNCSSLSNQLPLIRALARGTLSLQLVDTHLTVS